MSVSLARARRIQKKMVSLEKDVNDLYEKFELKHEKTVKTTMTRFHTVLLKAYEANGGDSKTLGGGDDK